MPNLHISFFLIGVHGAVMKQDPKENHNDESTQRPEQRRPFVEPEFRREELLVDGTGGRFHNMGNS